MKLQICKFTEPVICRWLGQKLNKFVNIDVSKKDTASFSGLIKIGRLEIWFLCRTVNDRLMS